MMRWLLLLTLLLACGQKEPERGWLYSAGDWAVPPAYHGNPWAPGGVGVAASYVYEPLFFYVPADGSFRPRLAERFEETESTVTVYLRKDVQWHDGKIFTSADVKTTFLLGKLKAMEIWSYLDTLETPDPHTVIFRFKRRSPVNRLRCLTEPITSSHALFGRFAEPGTDLQSAREVLFKEHPDLPVGTGPFRLTRVTPSDMTLERFPAYYRPIALHGVRLVRWGRNEVVWSYLFSGGVDALSPACPADLAQEVLARNPEMRLITPSDLSEMGLLLNSRHPLLRTARDRSALSQLLDRDQIRTIASTYSETVKDGNLGLVQSEAEKWLGRDFLNDLPRTAVPPRRFQGQQLQILAPAGFTDLALLAEVAAAQLQGHGLKAQVRLVPGELYSAMILDGDFDIAASFGAQMGRWAHPSVSLSRFFYRGAPLAAGSGIAGPTEHAKIQALLEETDPARSRQLMRELVTVNDKELGFIPCFEKRLMIFLQDGVRVTGWPDEKDPIWSAAPLGVEALYCELAVEGRLKSAP